MGSEETTRKAPEPKPNGLVRFITTHWVALLIGFCGGLASLIALPFTVFPGLLAPTRKLTYCISPLRTPIVQTANSGDISIYYRGFEVDRNVTAAQIAIWNAGAEPIKPENILRPIYLCTPSDSPILEATLLSIKRDVIEFSLAFTNSDKHPQHFLRDELKALPIPLKNFKQGDMGDVQTPKPLPEEFFRTNAPASRGRLSWKILEHGDGVLLQIVYAGTPETPISMEGVIEGQGNVVHRSSATKKSWFDITESLGTSIMCGAIIASGIQHWSGQLPKAKGKRRTLLVLSIVVGIALAVALLCALYTFAATRFNATPFGF